MTLTYGNFHEAGFDARVIGMTRMRPARREAADEELGDVTSGADEKVATA